jgi:hypothetical protein
MDNLLRLILRFLLIPFGYLAAVIAGTLVILFGSWRLGELAAQADSDGQGMAMLAFVIAGPTLFVLLLWVMWLPSAIGILLAEAFALRSWMYHAANGAVSAWLAWSLFGGVDASRVSVNQPMAIIAAGLAGGFAYWAVAGWNAGFWKPVFHSPEAPAPKVS